MKKNINFSIILILILIILLFIFIFFRNYQSSTENIDLKVYNIPNMNNRIINHTIINKNENTPNKFKYYRCETKLLGEIIYDIFNLNNITRSNTDWNIYIPCGYNDVEEELTTIIIKGNKADKYIFGLNGCDSIVSKNKIWESLVNCYGRKEASKLMPESYILSDINEMTLFKKKFDRFSNEIYILKKNLQRKEGLKLTKNYFEIISADADNYKVAQKYITDLYLINERKVNLRVYLFVVIKNDIIYFYLCKIGKCIYTNKKYNHNDLDFESNITSYNLDMSIYKENPRHFNELKRYLDENGEDGTKLFLNIEKLMNKVSICLSNNLYQTNNIRGSISFQLFGADVIFDKNLHPYLLEINKGPDMIPRDDDDRYMKNMVQTDMFKILNIIKNNNYNNTFYLIYKKKIL